MDDTFRKSRPKHTSWTRVSLPAALILFSCAAPSADTDDSEDETQIVELDGGLANPADDPSDSDGEKATTVAGLLRENRGRCTTDGVEELASQLASHQACMFPDQFEEVAHPNIKVEDAVHLLLSSDAARSLRRAADGGKIQISSAFRTVAEQLVLYRRRGCQRVARPGSSNHQDGRAVDVRNYRNARSRLRAAGFRWFGNGDRVHFTGPGKDARSRAVLAFQRLWNLNHPEDPIREDGRWGTSTEKRLLLAPVQGFSISACTDGRAE